MKVLLNQYGIKYGFVLAVLFALLLFNASLAKAAATFVTDQAAWESMVSDIEILTTTAENVFLADEVTVMPGPNAKLGPILTFQALNTGLSRSFSVESLQAAGQSDPSDPLYEGGFTFDDHDGGTPITDSADALSVGDTDDFENDDWQLRLLDGATVMAFGIEIRHSKYATGETITLNLLANNETVAVLDIGSLPGDMNVDQTYFIGIVSDTPFDTITFNEDEAGDDIAIADFQFANVSFGTEYSSTLGNNLSPYFRDMDMFVFAGTEGEEVTVNLGVDSSGSYTGERATLILMDAIRGVCFYRIDRSALSNEITTVLPATGKYRIIVLEQSRRAPGAKFLGDYILSLDSSGGASETLRATRWVE